MIKHDTNGCINVVAKMTLCFTKTLYEGLLFEASCPQCA